MPRRVQHARAVGSSVAGAEAVVRHRLQHGCSSLSGLTRRHSVISVTARAVPYTAHDAPWLCGEPFFGPS